MDYVMITGLDRARHGLCLMLDAASDGMSSLLDGGTLVDVSTALLIMEIAKRAEDRDEWFPCGKWATIQAIQEQCEAKFRTLFTKGEES